MTTFKQGDIVRFTNKFLRSCGMVTGPVNGLVLKVKGSFCGSTLLEVQWCDSEDIANVLSCNVDLYCGPGSLATTERKVMYSYTIHLKQVPTYEQIVRSGDETLQKLVRLVADQEPAVALCNAELLVAVLARHAGLEKGLRPWVSVPPKP